VTGNPLDILLAHNLWATRQLLGACSKLTSEQFHRRFDIGNGSLHDAATHMLRQLGVSPLPASSVLEWMLAGDGDAA
jgi:uncharacterized damage-inducible protein DinB